MHGPWGKITQPLPVRQGGTGGAIAPEARAELGIPGLADVQSFTGSTNGFVNIYASGGITAAGNLTTDSDLVIDTATISPINLTDVRALTLPDRNGELAVTSDIPPPGGLTDGDYGDIVVSGVGTVMSLDSGVVTAAGRAILDDATAAAQRTTLGLGTIATFADAPSDGSTYGRNNGAWAVAGGSAGLTLGRAIIAARGFNNF